MRKKSYLKNSIYSVFNYILLILLSLMVRRTLVSQFPIEYVGFEALFTDIFMILSVADLGMDSIISYKLYDKIANGRDGVETVMLAAKKLYHNIAKAVVIIGIGFIAFIPIIFAKEKYDFQFLVIIYLIQLLNLAISYMTGYKRLLLVADQKEYICLRYDSIIMSAVQLIRIAVLFFMKNYYLYVALCLVQTVGQNLIISHICKCEYGSMRNKKIDVSMEMTNTKKDMGNFLFHRISSVIYAATDNVVITMLLGVISAGLYSNYYMVAKYAYSFITKIMKPMQASIGNFLYAEKDECEKYRVLRKLNYIAYFIGDFTFLSLIKLESPFVILWLGDRYQLTDELVILLAFNIFIAINQDIIYYFRNSFGSYDIDKKYMMLSAVSNLFISVCLVKKWGLEGVIIGTIIGHLFIWYGRVKFVYKMYFHKKTYKYWITQSIKIGFLFVQLWIIECLTKDNLYIGIKGMAVNEMYICIVIVISFSVTSLFLWLIDKTRKIKQC